MDRLLRALPLRSGGLLRLTLSFLAFPTKLFSHWLMPRLVITSSCKGSSTGSRELSDHEEDCAICLCKMEPGEERRELKCHHLFHKFCINKWFEHPRRSCPVCREPLVVAATTSKNRHRSEIQNDNVIVFLPWEDCDSDAWWIR